MPTKTLVPLGTRSSPFTAGPDQIPVEVAGGRVRVFSSPMADSAMSITGVVEISPDGADWRPYAVGPTVRGGTIPGKVPGTTTNPSFEWWVGVPGAGAWLRAVVVTEGSPAWGAQLVT